MRQLGFTLSFVLCGVIAFGQVSSIPLPVTEAEARTHLTSHEEPVYPPIAKDARIQGDVVIALTIDAKGFATALRVVSGPAMLQQSALDAVKTWRFKPFDANGTPANASTTLTIGFHLDRPGEGPSAEQQKAAQAYFPLEDKCRTALKSNDVEQAVSACKAAVEMSLRAGDLTSSDQLGMMDAYQLYGHALLAVGKLPEALQAENSAVTEAKKCVTDTDEEYAMPFFWRAVVEARLGQADAAFADLNTSEETLRRAIQHLPEMKKMYGQYLASILNQHAALLDQLGRSAEAGKLRAEAASL